MIISKVRVFARGLSSSHRFNAPAVSAAYMADHCLPPHYSVHQLAMVHPRMWMPRWGGVTLLTQPPF